MFTAFVADGYNNNNNIVHCFFVFSWSAVIKHAFVFLFFLRRVQRRLLQQYDIRCGHIYYTFTGVGKEKQM